jgi:2-iminobutanoate/2-iminopropanoate deaminase
MITTHLLHQLRRLPASFFLGLVVMTASLPAMAQPLVIEQVRTDPDPYEPYRISQAIKAGPFVFVSGQVGMDLQGRLVGGDDVEAQGDQAFRMLRQVLEKAGSGMDRIVKVNIYLTDMKHFPVVMRLRERHLVRPYPADTIVQVSALALPELKIEIDAIAAVR